MNFQDRVQLLRVQLLCMSRLSQRALDYSIKGFEFGSSDFCRQARSAEHKIGEYRRQIKYLSRQITMEDEPGHPDFRFGLAALRIDSALHRTFSTSAQMAVDTLLFLKSISYNGCAELNRFGRLVNSLVRLCTIALFEKEPCYAEIVIQSQELWRRCELIFDQPASIIDEQIVTEQRYVLTMAQSLGLIAKQAHEMADAILFWLKDRGDCFQFDIEGQDVLSFLKMDSSNCRESRYEPAGIPSCISGEFALMK
jgi:phosphate uptake regulator